MRGATDTKGVFRKAAAACCSLLVVLASFGVAGALEGEADEPAVASTAGSSGGCYISDFQIKSMADGTADFDDNDDAGNDSSATNNIVRTFDNINYTLEYTTALTDVTQTVDSGKVNVEFTIEDSPDRVRFDTDALNWCVDLTVTYYYADGTSSTDWDQDKEVVRQVVTGYRELTNTDESNAIPGIGTLSVAVAVKAACNGDVVAPTFKVWMDDDETKAMSATSEDVTVSAEARYNISLKSYTRLNNLAYFDAESGDISRTDVDGYDKARITGYGLALQVYNTTSSKGLKGIELPSGDIAFDITLTSVLNGTDVTSDETYAPYIWDYKENVSGNYGHYGRLMNVLGKSSINYLWQLMPWNTYSGTTRTTTCPGGGTFTIVQDSVDANVYHVTLSGYTFDYEDFTFPTKNCNYESSVYSASIGSNIGYFSVGYLQVITPFARTVDEDSTLQFNISASNLEATSISGATCTEEMVTNDNSVGQSIVMLPKGTFNKWQHWSSLPSGAVDTSWDTGNSYSMAGSTGTLCVTAQYNGDGYVSSLNILSKFDDEAFEVPEGTTSNTSYSGLASDSSIGTIAKLFAAKPDGSGWESDDEMSTTGEEELIYFDSLDALTDAGCTCVGILYEVRDSVLFTANNSEIIYIYEKLNIKSTAESGSVYQCVTDVRQWTDGADNMSWTSVSYAGVSGAYGLGDSDWDHNGYVDGYTTPNSDIHRTYVKRTYANGTISGGHTGGNYYGCSLLIIGAKNGVSISNTDGKTIYDLDAGERTANYSIQPSLSTASSDGSATTAGVTTDLTVTATIPAGLTYDELSGSVTPVSITDNADGTQTVVWIIEDCQVGETIDPITFSCTIGAAGTADDVGNNESFTVQATVTSDLDQRATTTANGTLATTSLTVIKLSAASVSKVVDQSVIELGESNSWSLRFGNNAETYMSDITLLDVLPHDDDSYGSDYSGSYKIDSITVDFSSAPLLFAAEGDTLELYVSTDAALRDCTSESAANNLGAYDFTSLGTGSVDGTTVTFDIDSEDLTGFYLKFADFPGNEYISINLNVSFEDDGGNLLEDDSGDVQHPGDYYSNSFVEFSSAQSAVVISNVASFEVIAPTLSLKKSADASEYGVGDTATYTLKVTQTTEGATAENVVVSDIIPEGLEYVDGSASISGVTGTVSYDSATRTLTATMDELAYDVDALITYECVVQNEASGQTLTNTATATADYTDEVEDIEEVSVPGPELAIEKVASGDEIPAGTDVTYTIDVSQTVEGACSLDTVVTDEIPDGLTYNDDAVLTIDGATADSSCVSYDAASHMLSVAIGDLLYGQEVQIVFSAQVDRSLAGSTVDNTASTSSDNAEEVEDDATFSVPAPELAIEKSADASEYGVGDTVTYTLSVSQVVENAIAYNVVVTDTIPEGMEYVDGSVLVNGAAGDASYDATTRTLTVNVGDMAYGEPASITCECVVQNSASGQTLTNTATTTADDTEEVEDTEEVSVPAPALSITKSASAGTVQAGTYVNYILTVNQTVEGACSLNTVVTDVIPEGLSYSGDIEITVDGDALDASCVAYDSATRTLSVALGDLLYGQEAKIILSVHVALTLTGSDVENVATAVGDNAEEVEDDDVFSIPAPILMIDKTAVKDVVQAGDNVAFRVNVKEIAILSAANNLVITDVIPEGLEYVDGSASLSGASGSVAYDSSTRTLTASVANLWFAQTATLTFSCTAQDTAAGTTVTNTASATADYADEVSDDAEVEVIAPAIDLEKSVGADIYQVGDEVEYTLTATQTTEGAVGRNVVISDPIPEGLEYVEGSAELSGVDGGISYDSSTRTLTATIDELGYNETATIAFKATATAEVADSDVLNAATATVDHGEGDEAEDTTHVVQPVLSIEKAASADEYGVGDTAEYTLNVSQTKADGIARNVVVTDVVPAGLEYVEDSVSVNGAAGDASYDSASRTLTVNVGDVAYGDAVAIAYQCTVLNAASGTTQANTATASADNADEVSSTEEVAVPAPALFIEKAASSDTIQAGTDVTYTIDVSQTVEGACSLDTVVTDVIPDGLTYNEDAVLMIDGAVVSDATITYDSGTLTAEVGDLLYGQEVQIVFTANVALTLTGSDVENAATASGSNAEEVTDDATFSVPTPELIIEKAVDGETVQAGLNACYTVKVSQVTEKAMARNVVVTDTIPDGVEYMDGSVLVNGAAASASYDSASRTLTVEVGELAYGEEAAVTYECEVQDSAAGTTLTNTASAAGDYTNEPSDSTSFEAIAPSIELTKSVDKELYQIGDTITYTLTVMQTVEGAVGYDVVVYDPIPAGLEYVADSATVSGVDGYASIAARSSLDEEGNVSSVDPYIDVEIPELAYGETATITFQCTVTVEFDGAEYEEVVNRATASVPHGNTDVDEATTHVTSPVVDIVKTSDQETYQVGDTVTYTLTVTQTNENAVGYDVVVEDAIPEGLEYVDGTATLSGVDGSVSCDEGILTAEIPELAYGQTATVTFQCTVGDDAADSDVTNVATATAPHGNTDTDEVTNHVYKPALNVAKTTEKEVWQVGYEVVYTINVSQTVEGAVAHNVVVTDEVPEGIVLESAALDESSGLAGSVETDGNAFTVNIEQLAYGETATIEVVGIAQEEAVGQTLTNTAYATADYCDPGEDSVDVALEKPELTLAKSASAEEIQVGTPATYTLVLGQTNGSCVAQNVVITDTLPEGMTLDADSITVVGMYAGDDETTYERDDVVIAAEGNAFAVTVGSVASEELVVVTYQATADVATDGEALVNTATAVADYTDEVTSTAAIESSVPILEIEKTADVEEATARDVITWTVGVSQVNPVCTAYNVVITDVVPDGLVIDPDSFSVLGLSDGVEYAISVDGQTITATIAELAYGETCYLSYQTAVAEDIDVESVTNVVNATADDAESVEAEATVAIDIPEEVVEEVVEKGESSIYDKTGDPLAENPWALGMAALAAAGATVYGMRQRKLEVAEDKGSNESR